MAALDFRNINTLWASVLADTLQQLGVCLAAICPGSRSTPLAVAFAQNPDIETIPVLDERSAAFFALGHGKRTGRPAVVVCTSGTAAANFLPAVIEARESRVPLLILTADRPAELRDCHSGQTIDQVKLYGNYPNWQAEIALPDPDLLAYLQQTIAYAWERTLTPNPASVHLNLPWRDPLAPLPQAAIQSLADAGIERPPLPLSAPSELTIANWSIPPDWQTTTGLIIAGIAQPIDPLAYAQAVSLISQSLGWPVLAEGLSPLRNYADLNPYLVSTYDLILRHPEKLAGLTPTVVIQLGDLPTSKELRQWLSAIRPTTWIVEASEQNVNALHLNATYLRFSVSTLAHYCSGVTSSSNSSSKYRETWLHLDRQTRHQIHHTMQPLDRLSECKIPWLLSQTLPPQTTVFIANSMPMRDVEFFWQPNNANYRPLGNRGANGIDGTISTAIGAAHGSEQPMLLLTGDLSFLHDTNGLLLRQQFRGSLTILLLNNNGGGIFAMLPIAHFEPPFTEFFQTPQNVDFSALCVAYQIDYRRITSWPDLQTGIASLNQPGISVWEITTDSHQDSEWRRRNLSQMCH